MKFFENFLTVFIVISAISAAVLGLLSFVFLEPPPPEILRFSLGFSVLVGLVYAVGEWAKE